GRHDRMRSLPPLWRASARRVGSIASWLPGTTRPRFALHGAQRLKKDSATVTLNKRERKRLRKIYRQDLVKRSQLVRIAAAWVITVPASGLMAAILYFTIRGMLLE
ncbi:Probable low-affinity inorganic phosphate transporter, partial [hydrothermal vent metagenome]